MWIRKKKDSPDYWDVPVEALGMMLLVVLIGIAGKGV